MKICQMCRKEKEEGAFLKRYDRKCTRSYCRECFNAYRKQLREAKKNA